MQQPALAADRFVAATQPPGKFGVVVTAQHLDFARHPASGWCRQPDALAFAFGHNFPDGATEAAGEDGVGCFAELFQFGKCPPFTTAVFWGHFVLINAVHSFDPLKRLGVE